MRRLLLLVFVTVLNGQTAFESFIDVKVPMRDGIHLSTNVFHPQAPGRYPAILVRTPYGKGTALAPFYRGFVERGYAFVIQDVRGMRGSEGIFRPLDQEGQDGDDTLNWIAAQPWSDGKVGMIGGSYLGIAQWEVAVHGNPHLKAIFPVVSGADAYRDRYYSRGGALKWGHRLLWMSENVRAPGFFKPDLAKWLWHTPERTADRAVAGQTVDWYQNVLDHPQYDRFWRNRSIREKLASIKVPVFAVGGWYDNYAESDLEAFSLLRSLGKTAYIVIGPWGHNMSEKIAGLDFGRDAALNVRQYQLEWFGHWLKGSALPPYPPARLFVTGENAWHGEDDWPPSDVRTLNVFLSTKGRANTAAGNGGFSTTPGRKQRSDLFTYDPKKPVPTRGGSICCNAAVFPSGPLRPAPHRAAARRPRLHRSSFEAAARNRRDRPSAALGFDERSGYGFHREAGGCRARRNRPPRHRWHPAASVPRRARPRRVRPSARNLRHHHRCRSLGPRLSREAPGPSGNLVEQLPSLRSQPQHRTSHRQ